jgi:hypothetical protein
MIGISSQGQVEKERKREESESNKSAICWGEDILYGTTKFHKFANICHGNHGIHMYFS